MSFFETCAKLNDAPLAQQLEQATGEDALRAIGKPSLTADDFLALLSPAAAPHLEAMAAESNRLTVQHFGRTIQLFTPIYLANHCSNHCVYCGFAAKNKIPRTQLTLDELKVEAEAIAATGLKHILILTGEAPQKAGVDYIEECMSVLAPIFPSVSIEVFAMDQGEYQRLAAAGIDGLTIYQETYNMDLYKDLHPAGPKKDFRYRLDAPERGCQAGLRVVNIGALLGLDEWRKEMFITGMHADYLQRKYPGVDIAISLPRMRPHAGEFQPTCIVSDREMVQAMLALRMFLPRASITISTREEAAFRENIMPLGVTRMSAGVTTAVGGHTKDDEKEGQFEISDPRSVDEMCAVIKKHGYQPVFKDWEPIAEVSA